MKSIHMYTLKNKLVQTLFFLLQKEETQLILTTYEDKILLKWSRRSRHGT